nr:calcium/sodium antiporter [Roseospira visakhapatnamensis]
MVSLSLVLAGVVLLPAGSHVLVKGAVAMAERLGVSALVVALTVVAFGTSLPELVVSLRAALAGSPGISVGNVVGSNIANVLLILGATAVLKPIVSPPGENRHDTVIMLAVTAVFVGVAMSGEIPRWQGGVMVALLAVFIVQSYRRDSSRPDGTGVHIAEVEEYEGLKNRSWLVIVAAMLAGLLAVMAGAHLMVTGAVDIARVQGVPEEVIGLTMVAVGTSLPELAVCVAAALKGRPEVAVGNVLGSNIFNILAILGLTALVIPIQVPDQILRFDLWAMVVVSLLAVPMLLRHGGMGRLAGVVFLSLYVAYIAAQYVGVARLLGDA